MLSKEMIGPRGRCHTAARQAFDEALATHGVPQIQNKIGNNPATEAFLAGVVEIFVVRRTSLMGGLVCARGSGTRLV